MVLAYSRLRRVLDERKMTVLELHRRMARDGLRVNVKSLYRLNRENLPLERLDLWVAGVICQVCEVPLSELIAFESLQSKLQRLGASKQKRLDALMAQNSEGKLTRSEQAELRLLVREAEEVALNNARILATQREKLSSK